MANDSSRNWRGWVSAICIAIFIAGAVFYVQYAQSNHTFDHWFQKRTTKHVSAPKLQRNFATEEAALAFQESLELDESRRWTEVRQRPADSLQAHVEPSTHATLLAPMVEPTWRKESSRIAETSPSINQPDDAEYYLTSSSKLVDDRPHYITTPVHKPNPTNPTIISTTAWPTPSVVLQELAELRTDAEFAQQFPVVEWSQQVLDSLNELALLQSMRDMQCEEIFETIRSSAQQILQPAKDALTPNSNSELANIDQEIAKRQYRCAHALLRRVNVWEAVWACTQQQEQLPATSSQPIDLASLRADIQQVRKTTFRTGDADGWNRFLLLDELDQVAKHERVDAAQATATARDFLARVMGKRLTPAQQSLIADEAIQRMVSRLSPLACSPVDFRQMMVNLERMEADSTHRCRTSLAEDVQTLRYMAQPQQYHLANTLNTFYRNANLRMAVSKEFLDRGLPKAQVVDRPVRQRILGADTRGASQVETSLGLELIPDKQAWNILLRLNGDVQSKTHSSRGPATFYNDSVAKIKTARKIRVDINGLSMVGEEANVATNDRLRGFDTDFDALPIVGDMLRYVVRQQFDSQHGIAQRIMRRQIAEQTDSEFDRQLNSKVKSAETDFQSMVLGPLDRLELNPMVVDLETTESRLIARYRVAGDDQMAAHTPRPLAPADSLISVQIHESAINNAIDKFGLSGRDWTLPELGQQLAQVLNQPEWIVPEETPTDITVRFAEFRPLTVEFTEGVMKLTLRFEELRQGEQKPLRDFIIRTHYTPMANGLVSNFEHTGVISVDGRRLGMQERLPLRAIFGKVFAGRSTIPIVASTVAKDPRAAGLAISQHEIRDGWLALAASPSTSPHVSALQGAPTSNTQAIR